MSKITTGFDPGLLQRAYQDSSVKTLESTRKSSEAEVEKAASGFEALLLHSMLKEMWTTTGSGEGLLGENSNESQIFRDMFNQAVADEVAKGPGIGVKQFLKSELSKSVPAASKKDREQIG